MVTTQLLYHYDNDYLDGYHLMVYTTFFRTLATFPREIQGTCWPNSIAPPLPNSRTRQRQTLRSRDSPGKSAKRILEDFRDFSP